MVNQRAASKLHIYVPAKVGTQPTSIRIDGRCRIKVGGRIRFKEQLGQRKWSTGIVTNIDPLRIDRH